VVQHVKSAANRIRRSLTCVLVVLIAGIPLAACSSPDSPNATATVPIAPTGTTTLVTPTSTLAPTPPPTESDATEPPTETAEQAEPEATITYDELADDVAALVDGTGGLVEVVITLADGTTVADINSHEPMEAASLYKLAIMVEVFIQREVGAIAFDEEVTLDPGYFAEEDSVFTADDIGAAVSVENLLELMITLSSNVAATALLDRVGNENVNLTMASLGLSSTEIRWAPYHGDQPPVDEDDESPDAIEEETPAGEESPDDDPGDDPAIDDEPTEESEESGDIPTRRNLLDTRADEALNVTTAADIADLYLMLVNGLIISETASQEMLALLEHQQINDRIPAYLPTDTIVAHKTGNLDGLVHDAGVIYAPAGPIIVVVLTEDLDEAQATDLIATIARRAYDAGS